MPRQLAWLKRLDRAIDISCLDIAGKVFVLHLPGEPLIKFQLTAQKMRHSDTVLVAGYGDAPRLFAHGKSISRRRL